MLTSVSTFIIIYALFLIAFFRGNKHAKYYLQNFGEIWTFYVKCSADKLKQRNTKIKRQL